MVRLVVAVLAGAGVAAAAALALGEYAFSGLAVVGAAVVVGLFVSEATVGVARRRSALLAAAGAALTAAGLLAAAWTATGHRLSTVPGEGWLALVVGPLAAAVRARPPRGARGSRHEPAPPG